MSKLHKVIQLSIVLVACLALSFATPVSAAEAGSYTPVTTSVVPDPSQPNKANPNGQLLTSDPSPSLTSSSPPIVGKVVWVRGTFKATSNNKARVLAKADPIYLHDTLTTDPQTQAQIVFTDNSLMTFKPSTKFYIENYEYAPKKAKGSVGKYIMNLLEGGFRTITGLIAKGNPNDYRVNTPVATIGVRGTDYVVFLDKNGKLFVGWYKGSPCVTSKDKTLCLDKGKPYAQASKDSAPVPLTQLPPELGDQLSIENVTFGGTFGPGGPPSATSILNSFCIQ